MEEGRRIKAHIEERNFSSLKLRVLYCFKVRISISSIVLLFCLYQCRRVVNKFNYEVLQLLHLLGYSSEYVNYFATFFLYYHDVSAFLNRITVYAEFRRDWPEAQEFYEEGVCILREVCSTVPCHNWYSLVNSPNYVN